jgi:porin
MPTKIKISRVVKSILLIASFLISDVANAGDEKLINRSIASITKAQPAMPDPTDKPEQPGAFKAWTEITDGWSANGYDVNAFYRGEVVSNLSGGLKPGTGFLGNLDVTLDVDMNKLAGTNGLKIWVYGLGTHGADPTKFIGDSFATSNIEASDTFKLFEFFLKQEITSEFSALIGLRDLNADFHVVESSKNFLNGAFGISQVFAQTGPQGPSIFPQAALASTLHYRSSDSLGPYANVGGFNAHAGYQNQLHGTQINTSFSDGWLFVAETGLQQTTSPQDSRRYAVGYWRYSKPVSFLDQSERTGMNEGGYALLDQPLGQGVSYFAKYTFAPHEMNLFHSSIETGLSWYHPFGRNDQLSLGWVHAERSGDPATFTNEADNESVLELVYKIPVAPGIDLKPDLQYVSHPGLTNLPDATVGTLEVSIKF